VRAPANHCKSVLVFLPHPRAHQFRRCVGFVTQPGHLRLHLRGQKLLPVSNVLGKDSAALPEKIRLLKPS
jgi:hypothetical protein